MAKVLLVEDDNNLREIYEMSLKAEGYETLAATNGEEALDVVAKNKPDLIISDVMMPKVSGFEMLAKLREDPAVKETPVIMMTALSQSEDKAKADRLGVKKYLVKSQVTLEDLAKVAKELVPPDGSGAQAAAIPPVPEPPLAPSAPADNNAQVSSEPAVDTATATPDTPPTPSAPQPAPALSAPAEPASVAVPDTTEPPAIGGTPTNQQTADQEQAAIEAQINAFIDTASTEANVKTVEATANPQPAFPVSEPSQAVPAAPLQQPVEPSAQPSTAAIPAQDNPDQAASAAATVPSTPQPAPELSEHQPPTEPTPPSGRKTIQPITNPNAAPDINQLVAAEERKEQAQQAAGPLPTGSVINVENPTTDAFAPSQPSNIIVSAAPTEQPPTSPASQVINPQPPAEAQKSSADDTPKVDPNSVAL